MSWKFENQIIYKNGLQVHFRGVGVGNWLLLESFMHGLPGQSAQMKQVLKEELGLDRAQAYWEAYEDNYFSEADVAFLAQCGCNTLRIPFNQKIFEDEEKPGVYHQRGFDLLERVFGWAEKYQQWVLLDMHSVLGAQSTDWYADCIDGRAHFWKRPDYQQRAIDLWCEIARRFKDHPRLIGYDLMCEPVWPDPKPINDYFQRCIQQIRTIDTHSIIQLEPNHWARDAHTLALELFQDPLVMVQGHFYLEQHYSLSEIKQYPDVEHGLTDEKLLRKMEATLDPLRIKRPGMIGEFGTGHKRRKHFPAMNLMQQQARVLDAHGIGRGLWSAKDQGCMGVLFPREDTFWIQFLARPEISDPLTKLSDLTRCAFGANEGFVKSSGGSLQRECHELFPNLEGEIVPRQVMECHRALDVLALRHVARQMALLSDSELIECARSFHFENCEHHAGYAQLLAPNGGLPVD